MSVNAKTQALEALIEAHATQLKLPTVKARFRAMAVEARGDDPGVVDDEEIAGRKKGVELRHPVIDADGVGQLIEPDRPPEDDPRCACVEQRKREIGELLGSEVAVRAVRGGARGGGEAGM